MATQKAIIAVSDAILQVLYNTPRPAELNDHFDLKVLTGDKFKADMTTGLSLFLYRIFPNSSHRTPSGGRGPDGHLKRTKLPVDLHYILTAWAEEASLQHLLIAWAMRALEDTPILPPALLNANHQNVFNPEENVELLLSELSTEDMFRIWETITDSNYQISVPYVARMIFIESNQDAIVAEPVQQRSFIMGEPVDETY